MGLSPDARCWIHEQRWKQWKQEAAWHPKVQRSGSLGIARDTGHWRRTLSARAKQGPWYGPWKQGVQCPLSRSRKGMRQMEQVGHGTQSFWITPLNRELYHSTPVENPSTFTRRKRTARVRTSVLKLQRAPMVKQKLLASKSGETHAPFVAYFLMTSDGLATSAVLPFYWSSLCACNLEDGLPTFLSASWFHCVRSFEFYPIGSWKLNTLQDGLNMTGRFKFQYVSIIQELWGQKVSYFKPATTNGSHLKSLMILNKPPWILQRMRAFYGYSPASLVSSMFIHPIHPWFPIDFPYHKPTVCSSMFSLCVAFRLSPCYSLMVQGLGCLLGPFCLAIPPVLAPNRCLLQLNNHKLIVFCSCETTWNRKSSPNTF